MALILVDRRQGEHQSAVGKVATRREIRDAVEDHWALGLEHSFLMVCVQLAPSNAASGREPADGVSKFPREAVEVVKADDVPVSSRRNQVSFFSRFAADRRHIGIDKRAEHTSSGALRTSLFPI